MFARNAMCGAVLIGKPNILAAADTDVLSEDLMHCRNRSRTSCDTLNRLGCCLRGRSMVDAPSGKSSRAP
jgi:hypothetical protein